MDKVGCCPKLPTQRKAKKKQVKDEGDRQKQAEKKKRRLEKALATSAALRLELEKKKQKRLEEQHRLDMEGAAIAEAVALHVLIGEDIDDSHQIMINQKEGYNPLDSPLNVNLLMGGYPSLGKIASVGGFGCVDYTNDSACKRKDFGIACPFPLRKQLGDLQDSYFEKPIQGSDICPGFMAAAAVSKLHLTEESLMTHSVGNVGQPW